MQCDVADTPPPPIRPPPSVRVRVIICGAMRPRCCRAMLGDRVMPNTRGSASTPSVGPSAVSCAQSFRVVLLFRAFYLSLALTHRGGVPARGPALPALLCLCPTRARTHDLLVCACLCYLAACLTAPVMLCILPAVPLSFAFSSYDCVSFCCSHLPCAPRSLPVNVLLPSPCSFLLSLIIYSVMLAAVFSSCLHCHLFPPAAAADLF